MFNVGPLPYRNQRSCRLQCRVHSVAVGRTDTIDYRPCMYSSKALKWGSVYIWILDPHCQKVRGSGRQDPTGSPPLHCIYMQYTVSGKK